MAKTYSKTGYIEENKYGVKMEVSKTMVEKSIADQTKLQENIQKNLNNLAIDLAEIEKI